jgi:adenylate cyclase
MALEIERKFLLANGRWRDRVSRSTRIAQGYLGGDACSVRVRIEDKQGSLNIKSKQLGVVRQEFEYGIPLQDAEALLELACGQVLRKLRHYIEMEGHVWEIDEFEGANAGLVVAEIELEAVDASFPRPDWLGEEVTDDARYYNVNLMREPYSRWSRTPC